MSDSDDDLLPSNVFTFRNENTIISAKGPDISKTVNVTGNMTSVQMPVNFERQRYRQSSNGYHQRSMYYTRETSPMSLRSVPDLDSMNFQQFYRGGMSSRGSVFNGRSGSPVSVRSTGSNVSVIANGIASAFNNVKFNKYDLRIIKDAYNKLMRNRYRRKIEKRRNLKLFLKGTRRKSGDDSGELGSDSSVSSDDCRSTQTTICKENIPLTRPDLNIFSTTVRDRSMFTDCTENFKQNTFRKNMFAVGTGGLNYSIQDKTKKYQDKDTSHQAPTTTQRERFQKSFLLPSQRFNKSVNMTLIDKEQNNNLRNKLKQQPANRRDGDQAENSTSVPLQQSTFNSDDNHRKRLLDPQDISYSAKKRSKLVNDSHETNFTNGKICNTDDFVFAKPQMPIKKICNLSKTSQPEKLISKSTQPLIGTVDHNYNIGVKNNVSKPIAQDFHTDNDVEDKDQTEITQNSASDMSQRPSFIKRKLFTQKLDVVENGNLSSDSTASSGPQANIYSASSKEKNKTRKLVTSQSCLSRDIHGEDSNVLDLIHKIVPRDQINITNKNETHNRKSNSIDNDDKWDVTSVISTCNNGDVSDTYTDEEIFASDDKDKTKRKSKEAMKKTSDKNQTAKHNAVNTDKQVEKTQLPQKKKTETIANSEFRSKTTIENNDISKKIRSFWDTDSECDMGNTSIRRNIIKIQDKEIPVSNNKNKNETKEKAAAVDNTTNKNKNVGQPTNNHTNSIKQASQCKIFVEKMDLEKSNNEYKLKTPVGKNNVIKKIRSFWDTDSESDFGNTPCLKRDVINKVQDKKIQKVETKPNFKSNQKQLNTTKCKVLSVRDLYKTNYNKTLNSSIRSQLSAMSKNKILLDNLNPKENKTDTNDKTNQSVKTLSKDNKLEPHLDSKKDSTSKNVALKEPRKPKLKECSNCSTENVNTDKSNISRSKSNTRKGNKNVPVTSSKSKFQVQNKKGNSNNTPQSKTVQNSKEKKSANNLNNKQIPIKQNNKKSKSPAKKDDTKNTKNGVKVVRITKAKIIASPKPKKGTKCNEKSKRENGLLNITLNSLRSRTPQNKKKNYESSMSELSSANISNISNRSLRSRQKTKYCIK